MFAFDIHISEEQYCESYYEMHDTVSSAKSTSWISYLAIIFIALICYNVYGIWGVIFAALFYVGIQILLRLTGSKLRRFLYKQTLNSFKKRGTLPFSENYRLEFQETFFTMREHLYEGTYQYASISRFRSGKDAFYLHAKSAQTFIVPFFVFQDELQKKEFETFINEKLLEAEKKT